MDSPEKEHRPVRRQIHEFESLSSSNKPTPSFSARDQGRIERDYNWTVNSSPIKDLLRSPEEATGNQPLDGPSNLSNPSINITKPDTESATSSPRTLNAQSSRGELVDPPSSSTSVQDDASLLEGEEGLGTMPDRKIYDQLLKISSQLKGDGDRASISEYEEFETVNSLRSSPRSEIPRLAPPRQREEVANPVGVPVITERPPGPRFSNTGVNKDGLLEGVEFQRPAEDVHKLQGALSKTRTELNQTKRQLAEAERNISKLISKAEELRRERARELLLQRKDRDKIARLQKRIDGLESKILEEEEEKKHLERLVKRKERKAKDLESRIQSAREENDFLLEHHRQLDELHREELHQDRLRAEQERNAEIRALVRRHSSLDHRGLANSHQPQYGSNALTATAITRLDSRRPRAPEIDEREKRGARKKKASKSPHSSKKNSTAIRILKYCLT